MDDGKRVILIAGQPGVGKTTCLQKIVASLPSGSVSGFISKEIRVNGTRMGFQLEMIDDGRFGLLASPDVESTVRFWSLLPDGRRRLGVAFDFLDSVACPRLRSPHGGSAVTVVDEIGPMQASSSLFREVVGELIDGGRWVVASIAQSDDLDWIVRVRNDPRAALFEVSVSNRNELATALALYVGVRCLKDRHRTLP